MQSQTSLTCSLQIGLITYLFYKVIFKKIIPKCQSSFLKQALKVWNIQVELMEDNLQFCTGFW